MEKSEILNPDQLSLFEDSTKDDEPGNEPSASTEVEEYVVHRRKKAKGVRQANLDALPQVDKIYKLKGKNCLCDTC